MNLADILSPEQIIPDFRATNRWEAIDELINNLVATGKIKPEHRDAITAVVRKARNLHEHGHRLWHRHSARLTDLIYEVVGALGRSKKG